MFRTVAVATAALAGTAVLATSVAHGETAAPPAEKHDESRSVVVRDASGESIGTVTLKPVEGGTEVSARLTGLEPGFHGFHVHAVGMCDPEAPNGPFTSAGGHYVGEGGAHGTHDGDLPSLLATAQGEATLLVVTDAFTIDELLDDDGSAVMVHAGRDNFANIPDRYVSELSGKPGPDSDTLATGDAGARFACGELREEPRVDAGRVTVESNLSVKTTTARITGDIEEAGLTVFAVIDHAAAAAEAGLELPPSRLIMFGSPEAGTPLIQAAPTAGIDLPLKILVWTDAEEQTYVTYNDPDWLAERHGITGQDERLDQIEETLHQLATGTPST